jgi:hypothetical protein
MSPVDGEKRDVLDLLYEDGDESALSSGEKDELSRWREVRGARREALPDQEPSRSIEVLMAAAREHAAAREPRGLWGKLRGWFAVMAAHPAMSAAATVVLVGGVAGALYVSGRVGSEAKERETVEVGAMSGESAPRVPPPQVIAKDESPPVATVPEVEIPTETHDSPAPSPAAKVEKKVAPQHHVIVVPHRPAPAQGGADEDRAPVAPLEETVTGDLGNEDQGEANGVIAEPPPPPPPPPASPAPAPAPITAPGRAPTADRPTAQAPAADPAALTRQAKAAAKRKDCKTVDALANRVIEIDLGYYRSNFAPDPEIRGNCDAATRK